MWRSLVARMVRDHEAASSNLAIPTRKQGVRLNAGPLFIFLSEIQDPGPEIQMLENKTNLLERWSFLLECGFVHGLKLPWGDPSSTD